MSTPSDHKLLAETLLGVLRKAAPQLFDEDNHLDRAHLFALLDDREIVRTAKQGGDENINTAEAIFTALLKNPPCKQQFFIEVGGATVFKAKDFRFFLEENKVDNSFTVYKNRIGLTAQDKFIENSPDVVLSWPYKDCVLAGGQSTDEGKDIYYENKNGEYESDQSPRKEIFFNETLAHDEIDRLTNKKALVKWKRYTQAGAEEVGEIKRDEGGIIRENLIIKGNNLLALHALKQQFTGKIKLIYIDPPYNTGGDSFKYNDNFNHSTWLTFMKNRLELARELLKRDGVIFVQCDDNEQAYLKVLMDEIFGKDCFETNLCVKMSHLSGPKMAHKEKKIPKLKEYILMYSKTQDVIRIKPQYIQVSWYEAFKDSCKSFIDKLDSQNDISKWRKISLRQAYEKFGVNTEDADAVQKFNMKHAEQIYQTTLNRSKNYPREPKDTFIKVDDTLIINGREVTPCSQKIRTFKNKMSPAEAVGDIWMDIRINAVFHEGGKEIKLRFGKKPEMLIKRIIDMVTIEGDIVLDFFLGTGTSCAVAHKMKRQYIGIEQLDYKDASSIDRLKNVIKGDSSGISKDVDWKNGGNFIYCELAQWNEKAKQQIVACKDLPALEKLFAKMDEEYFLHYNMRVAEFREKICKEEKFRNLPLDKIKEIFAAMLDLNQLYVPRSEMSDKRFGISKNDQKYTIDFYGMEE